MYTSVIFIAEIGLNGKGVGLAIVGNVEVQIVSLASGTVVVVQERNVVSVCILASCLNGHSFEGNQLVLMVDELVFSQKVCYIQTGFAMYSPSSISKDSTSATSISPDHSALYPVTLILVPGTSFSYSSSEQGIL